MPPKTIVNKDPYAVLGVSRDASPETIRKAYKALMRNNHPDRVGNTLETSNIMTEVKQAYDKLADPEARAEEDRILADDPLLAWLANPTGLQRKARGDTMYNDEDEHVLWHAVDIHNRNGDVDVTRHATKGQEVNFDVNFLPL